MSNPLLDRDFLDKLYLSQEREIFARIISLTIDEEPLQEITGAVTGGSLSVDGTSSVRRTCSLTIVSSEVEINAFYWGLHTKFKLFIGLRNKIDEKYPNIIWFPEGIFAITAFNTTQSTNNYTINISGKDKMCYLNGELGGTITALTHDFGTYDYTDEYGFTTNQSNLIKDIIVDAVHEFAHEPFQNIIVNDLDDYGIELLEYRGEQPMYFLIDSITKEVSNALIQEPNGDFLKVENGINENLSSNGKGILSHFRKIEWADWSENKETQELEKNVGAVIDDLNSQDIKDTIAEDLIAALKPETAREDEIQEISAQLSSKIKSDFISGTVVTQELCLNEIMDILNNTTPQKVSETREQIKSIAKKYNGIIESEDIDYINKMLYNMEQSFSSGELDQDGFNSFLNKLIETEKKKSETFALNKIASLKTDPDKDTPTVVEVIKGEANQLDSLRYAKKYQNMIENTASSITQTKNKATKFSQRSAPIGILDEGLSLYDYILKLDDDFIYDPLFDLDLGIGEVRPTLVTDGTNYYSIAKIEYGQTAGYRLTDLTYAGDLIINAGESVTSMLDKIIQMLGNFEYFYDEYGHFIFQKKKTYINTSWNNIIKNQDEEYVENAAYTSATQYSFEDSKLITSFSNNPDLANLKNDYSIWGTRKGVTGTEIPVHMRYAIDTKPSVYKSIDGYIYTTYSKEEYLELLNSEERESLTFNKKPNENGLPEDWWEIRDWANYYKLCTGYYPTEWLGYYCEPIKITVTDYFEMYNPNHNTPYTILSDDIILRDGKFYSYHGSCAHTYTWWLDYFAKTPNSEVYFHKPTLPDLPEGGMAPIVIDENLIVEKLDWRELIYQMAKDYRKYSHDEDYAIKLYKNNPSYVKNGLTGYEQYYTDLEGFWRQLYNPEYIGTFETVSVTSKTFSQDLYFLRPIYKQCKNTDVYHENIEYFTYKYDWKEIKTKEEFDHRTEPLYDQIYNKLLLSAKFQEGNIYHAKIETYTKAEVSKDQYYKNPTQYYYGTTNYNYYYCKWYGETKYNKNLSYFKKTFGEFDDNTGWLNHITEYPETLNFWFDFLDSGDSELGRFSVSAVGDRTKSANDNNVKAIYFRETPTVIFMTSENAETENQVKTGYSYIQLSANMENLFSISSQGKSAKDVLDEWLYQYSYCAQSITVSAIPVYTLKPNTRIYIRDDTTKIEGEYIVAKLTIPLTAKGIMSINATKAVDRIY